MDISSITPNREQYEIMLRRLRTEGLSPHDAEEALQDAWLLVAEKEQRGEVEVQSLGYVVGAAKFRRMAHQSKRNPRNRLVSLDAMTDGDNEHEGRGDSLDALIDQRAEPEPVDIIDLQADPITALRLALVKQGAGSHITARGTYRRNRKYTDEQVEQVRELHARGNITHREIAELTGVSVASVSAYLKRKARQTPSMEGWSTSMIEGALRAHYLKYGEVPEERDMKKNPALPSYGVVRRLYGNWSAAIHAAGLEMRCGDFKEVWTEERILGALCEWWHREKRVPTGKELYKAKRYGLPSTCTLQRKLGTSSGQRLIQMALDHCAHTGCALCPARSMTTTEGSK